MVIVILSEAQGCSSAAMTGVMERPAIFGHCHGWQVAGQCICPWTDGSRVMHMYRMYGSRVMQEQLPRSSCQGAIADKIRTIFNKPKIIELDQRFPIPEIS